MNKINLCLIFHFHQPVGNFENVFRLGAMQAYLPLLRAMNSSPDIPFALHISGPLLEYLDASHPEAMDLITTMCHRGQLELLGGGFYEPILTVIPEDDALEQIDWMADFLEDRFDQCPSGIWLTERIWEPHLPSLLHKAGIQFTAVDDYHFKAVGVINDDLFGYYFTEHEGKKTAIFPISETLRYTMPFKLVGETIDYLASIADNSGNRLIVFGDDGEKFGMWPGTHKWVWQEGWFRQMIDAFRENHKWLRILTPSQALEELPAKGLVYLPTGSYFEMSEWTLPHRLVNSFTDFVHCTKEDGTFEKLKPFIKGGFWRNFFTKYPESNWMHKRMLFASQRLDAEESMLADNVQAEAEQALYSSQCNCAYWHGVFGGLYLPHLRNGIWSNILKTEQLLGQPHELPLTEDIDCDGNDEILIANNELSIWIKPSYGGMIAELSLPQFQRNITDTLARYPEGYHRSVKEECQKSEGNDSHSSIHDIKASKENGLWNFLGYDWHMKRFAHEHFFTPDINIESYEKVTYRELGDFVNQPFEIDELTANEIVMSREGNLWLDKFQSPLKVQKRITLDPDNPRFSIEYVLLNKNEITDFIFAVETNLALESPDDPMKYFIFQNNPDHHIRPGEMIEFGQTNGYEYHDHRWGLRLSNRGDCDGLWMLPLQTVSQSESGFEKLYQATTILHLYRIRLLKNEEYTLKLSWWFSSIEKSENISD